MANPPSRSAADSPSAWFTELGRRLESRWAAADRDEETFPVLAREELENTPPGSHVDVGRLVDELLDPLTPAPRQLAPVGAFGQPGFTVHHGRGFVIDVYFWNNAVPAVHDHPFAGVFTLLRGSSLHRAYRVSVERELGARVRIGTIEPEALTLLGEGEIVSFSRTDRSLVHSLVHVPNPSVSLVARTIRADEYFRYFPPSVALAMSQPDDWIVRQLALLDMRFRAGDPRWEELARRFLSESDFEVVFRVVSGAYGQFRERGRVEALLALVPERHAPLRPLLVPAVETAARLHRDNAYRERFTEDGDRYVASVLMCALDREEVTRLLGLRFEGHDPATVLAAWMRAAGMAEAGDAALEEILRRVLAGEAFGAVIEDLHRRHPGRWEDVDPAAMEASWRESLLRAVLEPIPPGGRGGA